MEAEKVEAALAKVKDLTEKVKDEQDVKTVDKNGDDEGEKVTLVRVNPKIT